ncbi:histidine phosphatase family protein [Thauera sp. SWB20]|uniref:histidine phosphatase family protein n=1 Tax=Thauera sp. SWB20 TaxID=1572758 RepID=UPI0005ADBB3E|nr:histidine phosphatase family protein [Thauera sp. SWB20]KIN91654.1 histidine phosphatase super family protein [Thauera sp. SWB20]
MSAQASDWRVPAATLRWLDAVPADRGVAMLVRHSVRDPLPPGDLGYANALNAEGVELARSLGERLHGRLRSLHTSPLQRCVHTAEVFARVAGDTPPIVTDRMLGDPGAWVLDRALAGENWKRLGSEGIMEQLATTDEDLPGTRPARVGAQNLAMHMLAIAAGSPGLHVFVTHDILLAIAAARFLGPPPAGPERWPGYLEAAFFWQDDDGLHAGYRDRHRGGLTGAR